MDGSVPSIINKYGLVVEHIHTHIESGSYPTIWQQVMRKLFSFCAMWDTLELLNLGGGYKVGRNLGEKVTVLGEIGAPITNAFQDFATEHGQDLRLEIKPEMYLIANAGALVTTIQDKVGFLQMA